MDQLSDAFTDLSTPLIADACVRLGVDVIVAPPGLRPVHPADRVAGPVLPVRHYGSVDLFLEALESARGGEVLVIDNGGRTDEACIGDLTVLEAQAAGLAGMLVWGRHRDTPELDGIDFPVFSYGAYPLGPLRLDQAEPAALESARFGTAFVDEAHVVFADADGAVFVQQDAVEAVLSAAVSLLDTERRQASQIDAGVSLRVQLRFSDYLELRADDPSYSFRQHLRAIGGAIEE